MEDYIKLKLNAKRLIKLIDSGSVKGNRLHDLQGSDTFKTLKELTS